MKPQFLDISNVGSKTSFFGAMIDVSASMGYRIGLNEADEVGRWMKTVLELLKKIYLHVLRIDNKIFCTAEKSLKKQAKRRF